MAEKHNVAMFIQGDDGQRVQVGWASPKDADGVRTFEYSPGFEETRPRDVSFEDDELSQAVAEEQHEARLGDGSDGEEFEVEVEPAREDSQELPPADPNATQVVNQDVSTSDEPFLPAAEPVFDAPDETQAAEPTSAGVEPDTDLADDPTDAGVEPEEDVQLDESGDVVEEDEEAEFERLLAEEEANKNNQEQPQTRREAREQEENN